ncbi:hypothetical protein HN911_13315 [Candidatus Bathyarchaeota archaeon]|jgi:hypothetical protein|nr:hypothetical protein [Candidatus Bathyarchaeota archaeon]
MALIDKEVEIFHRISLWELTKQIEKDTDEDELISFIQSLMTERDSMKCYEAIQTWLEEA